MPALDERKKNGIASDVFYVENLVFTLPAWRVHIHHIAFEVADIRAEMARLKAEGFTLLNEEPKRGADNKLVCFIHPKSAHGVLVELTQEIA